MPPRSGFLDLPRELRDIIYHHYVFEIDGYHFSYKSGKLQASDNRNVDLSLMYTCSFVATEMRHLALRSNVINFFPLETERKQAALFDFFHVRVQILRSDALRALKMPTFQGYKTPDVDAEAALRYPQFEPLLSMQHDRHWLQPPLYCCKMGLDGSSWGEADSAFRAFQEYLIKLLSRDTDFPEALATFYDEPPPDYADDQPVDVDLWLQSQLPWDTERAVYTSALRRLLRQPGPEVWSIPSEEEIAYIKTCLGSETYKGSFWERVRWRFSAAAVAIHFFNSVSQNTRLGIRKVVLHEDRRSVAHPECHALGLIPFCIQNPQLYIERRVNIWRVLISEGGGDKSDNHQYVKQLERIANYGETDRRQYDRFVGCLFSSSCCRWITEALALAAKGMPTGSFSLVLDGDPAPDQGWKLFELVKEAAAWQTAQAEWHANQSPKVSLPTSPARAGFYLSEVFPQAINNIVNGKNSLVRCNFPTGDLYDPGEIFKRHRHLAPPYKWVREWTRQRSRNPVRLSPPLPALMADIVLEDLMDEEQHEAA